MSVPVLLQFRAVSGGVVPGATIPGQLTTDHAASSYGLPVAVADRNGAPYGPAECRLILLTPPESADDVQIVEAAAWVGFEVIPAGAEVTS